MLKPDYPIETERLLLRQFVEGDFDEFYALQAQPEVHRYVYTTAMDATQARDRLTKLMGLTSIESVGDSIRVAVIRKDGGEFIGELNLNWTSKDHMQGEIGYMFDPRHGGRGFATEAVRELLRLGFEGLELHRIFARLDARNEKSAHLLERLGMRQEAHLKEDEFFKGEWSDCLVYAMLASEWQGPSVR